MKTQRHRLCVGYPRRSLQFVDDVDSILVGSQWMKDGVSLADVMYSLRGTFCRGGAPRPASGRKWSFACMADLESALVFHEYHVKRSKRGTHVKPRDSRAWERDTINY